MAQNSKIEWTGATWNPVTGCRRVSPGCEYCYAERMARRLQAMGQPQYQGTIDKNGHWTGRINFVESALDNPIKQRKPTVYFVDSMSDLFHVDVKFDWLDAIWNVMRVTPQHTYQILTKRASLLPGRVQAMVDAYGVLPNVWLGVSVENQAAADERIPFLLRTQAAIRFLSCEPLLGAVGLSNYGHFDYCSCSHHMEPHQALTDISHDGCLICDCKTFKTGISWVIVGGESGPGARPMHPQWARGIRDECQQAGVPFFFKQWGNTLPFGQEESYNSGWMNKEYPVNDVGYICGKKAAGRLRGRSGMEPVSRRSYRVAPKLKTVL